MTKADRINRYIYIYKSANEFKLREPGLLPTNTNQLPKTS